MRVMILADFDDDIIRKVNGNANPLKAIQEEIQPFKEPFEQIGLKIMTIQDEPVFVAYIDDQKIAEILDDFGKTSDAVSIKAVKDFCSVDGISEVCQKKMEELLKDEIRDLIKQGEEDREGYTVDTSGNPF